MEKEEVKEVERTGEAETHEGEYDPREVEFLLSGGRLDDDCGC